MKDITYKTDLTWGDWMEIAKVARRVAGDGNVLAAIQQITMHPEVLGTLVVLSTSLDAEAFAAMPLEAAAEVVGKALESTGFLGKLASVFRSLTSSLPNAVDKESAKTDEPAAGTTAS